MPISKLPAPNRSSVRGKEQTSTPTLSRRQFLRGTALAGTFAALPTLIPGSALGVNGSVPPSARIVLGGIGVGGRGSGVLNWMLPEKDVQFVAICDAKRTQREAVKRMVDNKYGN